VANSRIIIVGLGATAIMFIGAVMYTSAEEAGPAQYAVQSNGADTGVAATGGGGCGGGSSTGTSVRSYGYQGGPLYVIA